ncbi:MAG: DMT family transporter, partial [Pseudomonadota bacterium]
IAFLYTDVVRVIVLFYAMPAWGFLLGWIVLRDPITPGRGATLVLSFLGLYVVFGRETGIPLPENKGDWFALLSGFIWALSALLILIHRQVGFVVHGVNFFGSAAVTCLLAAVFMTAQGNLTAPTSGQIWDAMIWVLPASILLTLPACFAAVFAPTRLNPGVAGLLFMVEVVVGAITAAIWANEVLGAREIIGLILIMMAGLMDPLIVLLKKGARA